MAGPRSQLISSWSAQHRQAESTASFLHTVLILHPAHGFAPWTLPQRARPVPHEGELRAQVGQRGDGPGEAGPRAGRAGLGAVDAGRPPGRPRLPVHAVPHAAGVRGPGHLRPSSPLLPRHCLPPKTPSPQPLTRMHHAGHSSTGRSSTPLACPCAKQSSVEALLLLRGGIGGVRRSTPKRCDRGH